MDYTINRSGMVYIFRQSGSDAQVMMEIGIILMDGWVVYWLNINTLGFMQTLNKTSLFN